MEQISLPEAMIPFFVKAMQSRGGGKYVESNNPYSSSRLYWKDGLIVFGTPSNGFVNVGCPDAKEASQIYSDYMRRLAMEEMESDEEEEII